MKQFENLTAKTKEVIGVKHYHWLTQGVAGDFYAKVNFLINHVHHDYVSLKLAYEEIKAGYNELDEGW